MWMRCGRNRGCPCPKELTDYAWARRSKWLQGDGQQEEMETHRLAGLRARAELRSSNFGGTTVSEAVLKEGVLGKE